MGPKKKKNELTKVNANDKNAEDSDSSIQKQDTDVKNDMKTNTKKDKDSKAKQEARVPLDEFAKPAEFDKTDDKDKKDKEKDVDKKEGPKPNADDSKQMETMKQDLGVQIPLKSVPDEAPKDEKATLPNTQKERIKQDATYTENQNLRVELDTYKPTTPKVHSTYTPQLYDLQYNFNKTKLMRKRLGGFDMPKECFKTNQEFHEAQLMHAINIYNKLYGYYVSPKFETNVYYPSKDFAANFGNSLFKLADYSSGALPALLTRLRETTENLMASNADIEMRDYTYMRQVKVIMHRKEYELLSEFITQSKPLGINLDQFTEYLRAVYGRYINGNYLTYARPTNVDFDTIDFRIPDVPGIFSVFYQVNRRALYIYMGSLWKNIISNVTQMPIASPTDFAKAYSDNLGLSTNRMSIFDAYKDHVTPTAARSFTSTVLLALADPISQKILIEFPPETFRPELLMSAILYFMIVPRKIQYVGTRREARNYACKWLLSSLIKDNTNAKKHCIAMTKNTDWMDGLTPDQFKDNARQNRAVNELARELLMYFGVSLQSETGAADCLLEDLPGADGQQGQAAGEAAVVFPPNTSWFAGSRRVHYFPFAGIIIDDVNNLTKQQARLSRIINVLCSGSDFLTATDVFRHFPSPDAIRGMTKLLVLLPQHYPAINSWFAYIDQAQRLLFGSSLTNPVSRETVRAFETVSDTMVEYTQGSAASILSVTYLAKSIRDYPVNITADVVDIAYSFDEWALYINIIREMVKRHYDGIPLRETAPGWTSAYITDKTFEIMSKLGIANHSLSQQLNTMFTSHYWKHLVTFIQVPIKTRQYFLLNHVLDWVKKHDTRKESYLLGYVHECYIYTMNMIDNNNHFRRHNGLKVVDDGDIPEPAATSIVVPENAVEIEQESGDLVVEIKNLVNFFNLQYLWINSVLAPTIVRANGLVVKQRMPYCVVELDSQDIIPVSDLPFEETDQGIKFKEVVGYFEQAGKTWQQREKMNPKAMAGVVYIPGHVIGQYLPADSIEDLEFEVYELTMRRDPPSFMTPKELMAVLITVPT